MTLSEGSCNIRLSHHPQARAVANQLAVQQRVPSNAMREVAPLALVTLIRVEYHIASDCLSADGGLCAAGWLANLRLSLSIPDACWRLHRVFYLYSAQSMSKRFTRLVKIDSCQY